MRLYRLEMQALPYNAFAHRENRNTGDGSSDICTLFKAVAYVVDLAKHDVFIDKEEGIPLPSNAAMAVELVGTRFLRRMVRLLVVSQTHTIYFIYEAIFYFLLFISHLSITTRQLQHGKHFLMSPVEMKIF